MAYIRCSGNIGGSLKVRTASGNPCTFTTDLADALVSLTADIVCGQDLHGYDHPWAGGAGKNKLNPDYRENTSNNIKFYNGVGGGVALQAGQAYTISVPNGSTHPAAIYLQDYSSGTEYSHVYSQRTLTYTPSANCNIKIDIYYANSDMPTEPLSSINVQLEKGSTATSYEPYSNICPIVGYSELNLTRCGKNLFDKTTTIDDNWINSSGSAVYFAGGFYSALIPVKPNTAYYLSNVIGGNDFVSSVHFDKDMNVIGAKNVSGSSIQSGSITTFNNSAYMRINSNTANKDTVMVSEGSTPSAYEPYNGTPYLVQFGRVVYGGVYDANSGKVKPNVYYPSYNGETITGRWLSSKDVYVEGNTPTTGAQVVCLDEYDTEIDVPSISVFAENGVNNIVSDGGGDVDVSYLELIRGT